MAVSVTVLGLISTILLLNDPPSATETEMDATNGSFGGNLGGPSMFELNSTKLKQLSLVQLNIANNGRGIASVTSEETAPTNLIEIKCEADNSPIETNQIRLRLKGESCLAENATSTTIKNNSNGYIATVFHRPDFSFTTDYINLSEGTNTIAMAFETPTGPVLKTLTINRAPSSNSKN